MSMKANGRLISSSEAKILVHSTCQLLQDRKVIQHFACEVPLCKPQEWKFYFEKTALLLFQHSLPQLEMISFPPVLSKNFKQSKDNTSNVGKAVVT